MLGRYFDLTFGVLARARALSVFSPRGSTPVTWCLSCYLSVCLSACLPAWLPGCLAGCLPVCLSARLPVCLSAGLPALSLSLSLSLFVFLPSIQSFSCLRECSLDPACVSCVFKNIHFGCWPKLLQVRHGVCLLHASLCFTAATYLHIMAQPRRKPLSAVSFSGAQSLHET